MMLSVIVQPIDKEESAEPHITDVEELEIKTMVILEAGTNSGDTSVSFRAVDIKGKSYIMQMTGNIFRTAFSSFKGADEHFKEKRANAG